MESQLIVRTIDLELEFKELYYDLFGSEKISRVQWRKLIDLSITNHNIYDKMVRFRTVQLDRLEQLFALLCKQSLFPEHARNKWTFLVPSYIENYNDIEFMYFDTEEEASEYPMEHSLVEVPNVIFLGKVP
jgi:hypothetical protein